MSVPNEGGHQTADVRTPVVSLDKHGQPKTGLKQELAHYRQQQDERKPETRQKDTNLDGQQSTAGGEVTKGDLEEYGWDLSPWNWWNNARIMAGNLTLLVA